MNGTYGYAQSPQDARLPLPQMRAIQRYNPETVVQMASRATPDYYVPPENKNPLGFYFDLADFRGKGESSSALEVYVGVQRTAGHYMVSEKETWLDVERTVAVLNTETGAIYRKQGEIHFRGKGDLTMDSGAFVPDIVRLDLPPGKYRMEVSVKDLRSPHQGRYRFLAGCDPHLSLAN